LKKAFYYPRDPAAVPRQTERRDIQPIQYN
jgi:hypothetical protein